MPWHILKDFLEQLPLDLWAALHDHIIGVCSYIESIHHVLPRRPMFILGNVGGLIPNGIHAPALRPVGQLSHPCRISIPKVLIVIPLASHIIRSLPIQAFPCPPVDPALGCALGLLLSGVFIGILKLAVNYNSALGVRLLYLPHRYPANGALSLNSL